MRCPKCKGTTRVYRSYQPQGPEPHVIRRRICTTCSNTLATHERCDIPNEHERSLLDDYRSLPGEKKTVVRVVIRGFLQELKERDKVPESSQYDLFLDQ